MSTHVAPTVTAMYDPVVPTRRRYVSTMTDEARSRIPAAVEDERRAHKAWKDALNRRNDVIYDQYVKGVEPRDLAEAMRDPMIAWGEKPTTREHVQRIVRDVREQREAERKE